MTLIHISMVWVGEQPPTHCAEDNEALKLFSSGPPDPECYRGGTWVCPKCGRYYAWASESTSKEETG